MMAEFREDPGGIMKSDAHRHVLGHMSAPHDDYGWELSALQHRLVPSVPNAHEVQELVQELEDDGLAEQVDGAWRQTQKGFDLLTGPIANEPNPEDAIVGPALVHRARPIAKK